MNKLFYINAAIAVLSTVMVITRLNAVHALLYLIASLLAIAVILFILGAPFVAALEVIIYAGAIMVLFVFVLMMLNLSAEATKQEGQWLSPIVWVGPSILGLILLGELMYVLARQTPIAKASNLIDAKQVGIALFGPYALGVELASFLLLAGLVGAYHLGRREEKKTPMERKP